MPTIGEAFVEIRAKLDGLADDVKTGISSALESAKGQTTALLAGAGAAGGVALAAGLAGAVSAEAANDKLAAQLGLTEAESARIGKVAGSLYSGAYGDSLETVNAAVKGVVQNIGTSVNSVDLQPITAKVLDLSTAFDQDLGGVTRAVGQAIKTGLAKDATEALDFITAGFQKGADKSEDFLDTLNEYGGQFQKLGLDGTTATGLISQGLQAGARDGDLVADALKEFSIRAIDGSKTTTEAFKGLGLSADEFQQKLAAGGPAAKEALGTVLDRLRAVKDPAEQAAIATGLFGTQSEDLGKALFALDPKNAVKTLGDVAGAADRLGVTLNDNAQTNIESFKRQVSQTFVDVVGGSVLPKVNELGATLATTLGPAISTAGTAVGPLAASLASLVTALPVPIVQALGAAFGVLAGALAAQAAASAIYSGAAAVAATVTGLFATSVNAETGAVTRGLVARLAHNASVAASAVVTGLATAASTAFAAAQTVVNAVLAANPIGLVVLALVALVGGLVIAYKNSETFREIVQAAFEKVQDAAAAVGRFVTETIPAAFETVKAKVSAAVDAVKSAVSTAFDAVKTTISTVLEVVKTVVTTYFEAYKLVVTTVLEVVKTVVTAAFGAVKTTIETVLGVVKTVVTTAFDAVKATVTTVLEAVKTVVTTAFNAYKTVIETVLGVVKTVVTTAFEAVKTTVTTAVGAVKTALETAWNAVKTATSTAFEAVRAAIATALSAVVTLVGGLAGRFVGALSSLASSLAGVATAGWNAFKGAISAGITATVTLAQGVGGKLVAGVGNLGSLLVGAGGDLLRGLANGITGAIGGVVDAAVGAAKAAVNAVKGALGINSPSRVFAELGGFAGQGLAQGLDASQRLVGESAQDLLDLAGLDLAGSSFVADRLAATAAGAPREPAGAALPAVVNVEPPDLSELLDEIRGLRAEVARSNGEAVRLKRSGAL